VWDHERNLERRGYHKLKKQVQEGNRYGTVGKEKKIEAQKKERTRGAGV